MRQVGELRAAMNILIAELADIYSAIEKTLKCFRRGSDLFSVFLAEAIGTPSASEKRRENKR